MLFLLLIKVLIVLIGCQWETIPIENSNRVGSGLLGVIDFLLDFSDDELTLLSEDTLDARNNLSDLNDLTHEAFQLQLELIVSRVVQNVPFVARIDVQDRVNCEDGNEFSVLALVTHDVLAKVHKGALH